MERRTIQLKLLPDRDWAPKWVLEVDVELEELPAYLTFQIDEQQQRLPGDKGKPGIEKRLSKFPTRQ